jgi:hypothetical protein
MSEEEADSTAADVRDMGLEVVLLVAVAVAVAAAAVLVEIDDHDHDHIRIVDLASFEKEVERAFGGSKDWTAGVDRVGSISAHGVRELVTMTECVRIGDWVGVVGSECLDRKRRIFAGLCKLAA